VREGNLQRGRVEQGKRKLQAVFTIVIVGMATCVFGTQDQTQAAEEKSLGEVVHKKSARKAKTVITNDDLPSRPPESSQAATDTRQAPAATGDSNSSEKHAANSATDSEPKVPGTLAEARSTMETLKSHEQQLIRRYDEIQRKLSETDNEHLRRVYSDALMGREENLTLVHKQIEEAKKAVRLAEEASKAQGDQSNAPK
jgi:hypothetical protein